MGRDEIWTIVAEAYAVHFLLFQCGLTADDVFVSTEPVANAPSRLPYANVIARKNGQEFLMWIAPLPGRHDRRAFRKAWTEFSRRQPQIDKSGLDLVVVASKAYTQYPDIRQVLIDKGLVGEEAGLGLLDVWRTTFLPKPGEAPS